MSDSRTNVRDALYEEPGPKLRRTIIVGTAIAAVLLAVATALIIRQFAVTGQLDARYWSFFLAPTTWAFLGQGFLGTLAASAAAGALALGLGLVLMLGRKSDHAPVRGVARAFVEFFRGVPSLLFIYFFFLVVPQYGVQLDAFWMIVVPVGLSASGTAAEVLRAGVNAVPKGQTEAAQSLGLSKAKTMFQIILPQAVKYIIPTLISQLVIVVKDTTLAYVVSYPDLLQNGRVLIANYDALVSVYLVVAVVYIVLNYLINKASVAVANRTGVKLVKA